MIRGTKKTGRRRCQFNSWNSNNNVIDLKVAAIGALELTLAAGTQNLPDMSAPLVRLSMQQGHFGAADDLWADLEQPFHRNSSPSLGPGTQLHTNAVNTVLAG